MTEVIVRDVIAAPVDAVWELVGDFGAVDRWSAIERCSVEGDGVGAVRTLAMPGGLSLRERLEAFDADGRSFSYSIVEPTPLPLRGYRSTLSLEERDGKCAVDWRGTFEPVGVSEDQAKKMVQGIYTGGIAALKKRLE